MEEKEQDVQAERVSSGFVILRSALTPNQQQELARFAFVVGADPGRGFWKTTNDGEAGAHSVLNSTPTRGRIYDAIDAFPDHERLLALCLELVERARRGMYWHADTGENDGDNDHPIVSFSIGNQCKFGYALDADGKQREYTTLASGDVAIWGGPQRMMRHCVKKVFPRTSPAYLSSSAQQESAGPQLDVADIRFNFTFRDAPTVRGREKEFETFAPYLDKKRTPLV